MLHLVLLTVTTTEDSLISADGLIPPVTANTQLVHPASAAKLRTKVEAKEYACSSKAASKSSSSWTMVSGSYRGQFQLVQEFGLNADFTSDAPKQEFFQMTNLERIADRSMDSADHSKLEQAFPGYGTWFQQLNASERAMFGQLGGKGHVRVLELFLQYSPSLSVERYGLQETYTLSSAFGSLGGLFSVCAKVLGIVTMALFGCARTREVRQLLNVTTEKGDLEGKDALDSMPSVSTDVT